VKCKGGRSHLESKKTGPQGGEKLALVAGPIKEEEIKVEISYKK